MWDWQILWGSLDGGLGEEGAPAIQRFSSRYEISKDLKKFLPETFLGRTKSLQILHLSRDLLHSLKQSQHLALAHWLISYLQDVFFHLKRRDLHPGPSLTSSISRDIWNFERRIPQMAPAHSVQLRNILFRAREHKTMQSSNRRANCFSDAFIWCPVSMRKTLQWSVVGRSYK